MSKEIRGISVVLCTYNGEAYLNKQLDSILGQTYPIDEIIIVDDCSTDATRNVLKQYQDEHGAIKLFFNDKNLGSNRSFKYAVSLANNDYMALCDQDDIWYPNKVEKQMNAIIDSGYHLDEKPIVVFHDLCLIDKNDTVTNASFWGLHKFNPYTFNFRKLLLFNIVTGCTCIINRSMKDEMMKSDMKDIIMHDYLIALIGYGFGNSIFINEPLMYYRSHNGTVTEKETISFANRIQSFISRVKGRNYLLPYILQISKFDELYSDKLDASRKGLVDSFVNLENKSIVKRIFYKWFIN